jgi:23S rRNA (adenine2030-N6)-methyltransferase
MHQKATPCVIFDTHAGCGVYDLNSVEACKTGEADLGIRAFLGSPAALGFGQYLAALDKANPGLVATGGINISALRHYPGSPALIAQTLRPGDRYVAAELHPEDFATLKNTLRKNTQIQHHNRDGYEAILALTPPPERRGLVLIDPPYEQSGEYDRIVGTIRQCHTNWPTGIYAVWYGIKDRHALNAFHAALCASGIKKQLSLEFIYATHNNEKLHGSGMIVINPPWQFAERMQTLYSQIHEALQTPVHESKIAWLVGE